MKQIKMVLLMSLIALFILPVRAEKVSLEQAKKVAQNQGVNFKHAVHKAEKSGLRSSNGTEKVLYYVFENSDNQGFVIVSGDDVAVPVLGYSDSGKYDESNLNFKYWMDYLSQEIAQAIEKDVPQSAETKAKWEAFLNGTSSKLRSGSETNSLAPLLRTLWNQAPYYNAACPTDPTTGELSVTGCMATAMAQVMNFHQWPQTRTATIPGYTSSSRGIVIPAISEPETYDWVNMKNSYNASSLPNEIAAVATLMYQAGVSMKMDYASAESGAADNSAKPALINYFDYNPELYQAYRTNFSDEAWDALIKSELDARRPLMYTGHGSGGHAFVCDGYDDSGKFHFNWGWGGYQNGYFVTTALTPGGGGIGGGGGDYSNSQSMLVNVAPKGQSASAVTNLIAKQNRPDKLDLSWVAPYLGNQWSTIAGSPASASGSSSSYEVAVLWAPENLQDITNARLTKVNFTAYTGAYPTNYTVVVYSRNSSTETSLLVYSQSVTQAINADWQPNEVVLENPVFIDPTKEWIIGIRFEKGTSAYAYWVNDGNTVPNPRNLYRSTGGVWSPKEGNFVFSAYFENQTSVTGYTLTRDGQSLASVTNTNYTDETIEGNTTYNYCVTPVFSTGTATESCVAIHTAMQYNPNPVNNLTATLSEATNVKLDWERPDAFSGSKTLAYMEGTPSTTYNYSGYDYSYAIRFSPEDMQYLPGYQLSKVSYYSNSNTNKNNVDLTIQIWKTNDGGSPELIQEQPVPSEEANFSTGWHEIILTTPLPIDIYEDLYVGIGVHKKQSEPIYGIPANTTTTLNSGKSDCIYINGHWQTLGYTVAVKAYAEPAGNVTSYQIARNNTLIKTINDANILTYTDNPGYGTFKYSVTAVYPNSKSNAATAQIIITEPVSNIASTWMGINSNWNNTANWSTGLVPTAETTVTIPNNVSIFPELSGNKADNIVNEILFKPGAELGRQDLLTYNKAHVELDFSPTGGLTRGKWHLLSMPLNQVYVGDFVYGGYPETYAQKYSVVSGTGQWNPHTQLNDPLTPGEGFALWIDTGEDTGSGIDAPFGETTRNYGLGSVNGIIRLPYFEDAEQDVSHRIHQWNSSLNQSNFYSFYHAQNSKPLTPNYVSASRDNNAYRLLDGTPFNLPVNFGEGSETDYFALVGNPYMCTIDFDAFYSGNSNIKKNYHVWSGDAYASYTPEGHYGASPVTRYIAPMQAFFVEKAEAASSSTNLTFNIADLSATNPGSGVLVYAPPMDQPSHKLNITADNGTTSILTFIAKRDYGRKVFSDADSRKFLDGIGNIPEIYTLKESENGLVPVGSNIVNIDDILIPLGLSTTYQGDMRFAFDGMDRYHAKIAFLDIAANREIDLTGLERYEYSFKSVPPVENGEVQAENNRFFIRIQKTSTGIEPVSDLVHVYGKQNRIYAVAGSANPIRQIDVYNSQGRLLYTESNIQASSHVVTLNTTPSGVCIVRLTTEQGVKSVKLLMNK